MRTILLLAFSQALLVLACAPRAPLVATHPPLAPSAAAAAASPGVPSPGGGVPFPDLAERQALFTDLVAAVRKYHLFSELTRKNLGRRWEDDLPALETEFARASDEHALFEALTHFDHALHDGHLRFSPPERVGRGDLLVLGLTLETEWINGAARYYVSEPPAPAVAPGVRAGDIVVSVAGVPSSNLTAAHALESSENNWRSIARDVADYLTSRSTASSATKPGDTEAWVLRHRDGGDVSAKLTWQKGAWPGEGADGVPAEENIVNIDYAPSHCSLDLPDRAYPGGYRLRSHGRFYCLYVSDRAPYDAYPIVRHFSVRYSRLTEISVSPRYLLPDTGWQVSAEYFTLAPALRALPHVKGIILDLRDNLGGNDPEWFLDWYAPAPYADMFTSVRTYAEYEDAAFRKRVENVDDDWYRWYRKATAGLPPGSDVKRPFKCMNADCTGDNRFAPAHGLVPVPVALLVGPGCMSSCAHIAHIVDENDFGPLVGEPTAATYTTQRLAWPVKTRAGADFGAIGLGLSRDVSGKTGEPLEGFVVHIDYPVERTFEGRGAWDAALVDAAVRGLREYRFPARTGKLGP